MKAQGIYIEGVIYSCLKVLGELGGDPAERTAERGRPLEPDPGNTGGGKDREQAGAFQTSLNIHF